MNEKELKKQLKKVADYPSSKADGVDEEFSRELADQADLEAQARANAADERQKNNNWGWDKSILAQVKNEQLIKHFD